jgi:hypothetical protein
LRHLRRNNIGYIGNLDGARSTLGAYRIRRDPGNFHLLALLLDPDQCRSKTANIPGLFRFPAQLLSGLFSLSWLATFLPGLPARLGADILAG